MRMTRGSWWLLFLALCLILTAGILLFCYKTARQEAVPEGTLVWEVMADV